MAKDDILDDSELQYHLAIIQRHETATRLKKLQLETQLGEAELLNVHSRQQRDDEAFDIFKAKQNESQAGADRRFRRGLFVAALEGCIPPISDDITKPDDLADHIGHYVEAVFERCKRMEAEDSQPGDPVVVEDLPIQEERPEHAVGESDLAVAVPARPLGERDDDIPF
jgi:hypothetical protein